MTDWENKTRGGYEIVAGPRRCRDGKLEYVVDCSTLGFAKCLANAGTGCTKSGGADYDLIPKVEWVYCKLLKDVATGGMLGSQSTVQHPGHTHRYPRGNPMAMEELEVSEQ